MTLSAIENGADIVKFQTHIVDEEMLNLDNKKSITCEGSLYEILKKCSLNLKSHLELKKLCEQKNKIFMSTPFSIKAVDMLSGVGSGILKLDLEKQTVNQHYSHYIFKTKKTTLIYLHWSDLKKLSEKFFKFPKKNIILMRVFLVS